MVMTGVNHRQSSHYDIDSDLVEPCGDASANVATDNSKDEMHNALMQKFTLKPKEPQFKKPVSLALYRLQQ